MAGGGAPIQTIHPVMQNMPFGARWRERGTECMWDMHEVPRSRARLPVGRICIIAVRGLNAYPISQRTSAFVGGHTSLPAELARAP